MRLSAGCRRLTGGGCGPLSAGAVVRWRLAGGAVGSGFATDSAECVDVVGLVAGCGPPVRHRHDTGFDQLETGEEAGDLLRGAVAIRHGAAVGVLLQCVVGLRAGHHAGAIVDRQVTSCVWSYSTKAEIYIWNGGK